MFDIGMQELIVIFIVALLVFGPKRLPELGRTIGKGIADLKKSMEGVKEQIQSEFYSAEIQKFNVDLINNDEKLEATPDEPKTSIHRDPDDKEIKKETSSNG